MAGSTDSEVWTLAGSVESDVWSDVAASSAKILDTDWVHIASDLQSTQASFKPFEETMPISNMSPKPTVQLSSKVTDWVEQQALEDGGPGTADAGTVAEATFKPSLVAKTGSKKYDIATLLQLRYTTDLANIELRIHPSALQGESFHAPYQIHPSSECIYLAPFSILPIYVQLGHLIQPSALHYGVEVAVSEAKKVSQ